MRNIKLTLEYDGTDFCGFQIQKGQRTVQGELEHALKKLFQKRIRIIGAGRTDSGAHAEAQVVNFHTASKLALSKIQLGLNSYLPEDLAVTQIGEVPKSFHAQFDAKWKTYEYCVYHSRVRPVLERKRVFHWYAPLDVSKMTRAARIFLGRHDFRAFEAAGARRRSAIRTVRKLTIRKKGNLIFFAIESNGFLYKMVRSLVGMLLHVGSGRIDLSDCRNMLTSKKRHFSIPTVPAHGLTLKKIVY